ncbi:cupin domain-containing protein [Paludisphaera rhizosphaerae]|uniref:hypothetical protein n=1 Tax=Paludisphaera rhizosphaerae TaxID=2711216 RepID=UPI0013ED3292|nr:hypothetical protein [Paludisphaera rhizosphaerae]
MNRTTACPEESQLLALAAGSTDVPPSLRPHIESCPTCLRNLRRLRAEIVHLRASIAPDDWSPPNSLIWRSILRNN